jgi:hypothetical protein
MYLIITEEGIVAKTIEISDEDKQFVDDGYGDIIDISDPDNPTEYYKGEWHEVLTAHNEIQGNEQG